ncbi:hypothetical protein ACS0TY_013727 [Phlomoides rotata]
MIEGFPDEQYSKLWDYAHELRNSNINSIIILATDEEDKLKMKSGFLMGVGHSLGWMDIGFRGHMMELSFSCWCRSYKCNIPCYLFSCV